MWNYATTSSLISSVFADLETDAARMWKELWTEYQVSPTTKLPNKLLSNSFPPCNYLVDKDGNLFLKFAVAGYKEKEIEVSFVEDHLILKLSPDKKEENENLKYFQRGIKYSASETKIFIPFSKYNVNDAEVILEDGLLSITITVKENAKPFSIKINKK